MAEFQIGGFFKEPSQHDYRIQVVEMLQPPTKIRVELWNLKVTHRFEKENHLNQTCTHRIHGTSIFTYIYHKNQLNVGKYTSPMDPMGYVNVGLPILVFVGVEPEEVKPGHFILRGMWVNEDREQQMRTAWLFCIEQGKDVVICDVSSVLFSTYWLFKHTCCVWIYLLIIIIIIIIIFRNIII